MKWGHVCCRWCLPVVLLAFCSTHADVREHTRLGKRSGTAINSTQAVDLTLTTSAVEIRSVQTWIRTAGTVDQTGQLLTTKVSSPEAMLLQVGQRVRTFSLASRSSMYQGRITRLMPQASGAVAEISLASKAPNATSYLLEIVTDQGDFLSIPNEAIIEEGDKRIVYVKQRSGDYLPSEIEIGVQGELYTQVVSGLKAGDQVVTIGSFFIDAEYKMKAGE